MSHIRIGLSSSVSCSEFIIEVTLPTGDQYQFECQSRATVDYVKNKIFKTVQSEALEGEKSSYVLQLAETKEFLFVEFLRFLSTDSLKQRAMEGLPIQVKLVTRDTVYERECEPKPAVGRGRAATPLVFTKKRSHNDLVSSLSKQDSTLDSLPVPAKKKESRSEPDIDVLSTPTKPLPVPEIEITKISEETAEESPKRNMRRRASQTKDAGGSPPGRNRLRRSTISSPNCSGIMESRSLPGSVVKKAAQELKTRSSPSRKQKEIKPKIKISETHDLRKTVRVEKDISLPPLNVTFENHWADETLSEIIEPNSFGYHTEVGDQGFPKEKFHPELFEIEMPKQENLYEKYFHDKDHLTFVGKVDTTGPVIISLLKDGALLRALIRVSEKTHHICIDGYSSESSFFGTSKSKVWLRAILEKTSLKIPIKSLRKVKGQKISQEITSFDQSHLVTKLKFGVLYCKDGQVTENEWFGNEHGSPAFDEFLEILGDRVQLKGWEKFRAGLDTRTDSTGVESVYTEYDDKEIMFHVSTLLPYSEADIQKIERKRHLGNDIVVVIFMDGKTRFPPTVCKSFFNHIYIVVQKDTTDADFYRVGVAIKDGVRKFGPSFPFPPLVHKDLMRDFMMTKMINGEWATYRSLEFAHKHKRTRNQQLNDLVSRF